MSDLDTGSFTNTITGKVTFAPLSPATRVALPVSNWSQVQDVRLALWSDVSNFTARAASNVNVYLGDQNLTHRIITCIKKALNDPEKVGKFREQYHYALDRWIDAENRIGDAFSIPTERDAARVKALKGQDELGELISQLGDDSTRWGWGGNLHLFNYIYRDVKVEPVSIGSILGGECSSDDLKSTQTRIQQFFPWYFTFSAGPMRVRSHEPETLISEGTVCYRFEILYSNPADSALNAIWGAVNSDSVLIQTVTEIITQMNKLEDNLAKYDRELGDPKLVSALEQTLQELKRNLEIR